MIFFKKNLTPSLVELPDDDVLKQLGNPDRLPWKRDKDLLPPSPPPSASSSIHGCTVYTERAFPMPTKRQWPNPLFLVFVRSNSSSFPFRPSRLRSGATSAHLGPPSPLSLSPPFLHSSCYLTITSCCQWPSARAHTSLSSGGKERRPNG